MQASQDLTPLQGYLEAAPTGMDVRYAWTLDGGHGENVRIIDIEVGWNLSHSDLLTATANPFVFVEGIDPQPQFNRDHGAAVLGEMVAANDGRGITGIAYGAPLGLINPLTTANTLPKIAEALDLAIRQLRPGDIIVIEDQSAKGPHLDPATGRGLLPIEYEQDIFEAIKRATNAGLIVIEPAGNGSENLDDEIYQGRFSRAHDSGAIIVGAGYVPANFSNDGADRSRTDESNYGVRVDVQGWGRGIATCGYGDIRLGSGENNFYTAKFGGTSGASAMLAGVAAVLQSIVKQRGLAPLTAAQMRRLLASTGTPQTGNNNKPIGPRPDLRAAIAGLETNAQEMKITAAKYKAGAGKFIVEGENFRAFDSVIEINGTALARMKYPEDYILPGGLTTYILAKGNLSALLPIGVDVEVTVFTPSTGKRSPVFLYRRP
ncbi:MAG: S8 family serine peptidase [Acidobacteria bacterium]|nr:S8 family serine peptidase [Acidobacteriota bacterium]